MGFSSLHTIEKNNFNENSFSENKLEQSTILFLASFLEYSHDLNTGHVVSGSRYQTISSRLFCTNNDLNTSFLVQYLDPLSKMTENCLNTRP